MKEENVLTSNKVVGEKGKINLSPRLVVWTEGAA